MLPSKKRKNRPGKPSRTFSEPVDTPPDPALFIQAYEADIIRGPQAKQAADSLDFIHQLSSQAGGNTGPSGLIQWNPSNSDAAPAFPSDADDDSFASSSQPKPVNNAVWVDRYDARLLLPVDSLPKFKPSAAVAASPPSPSGWSDLPSDTEDTFFFTPREAEDYRQQKRRRIMEEAREERLKARKAEDGEEEEIWGGSDEEPDEAQRTLMERTATSVISSGNPAQLEMRILANYGTDKRFAFLRGRWKVAWATMKRKAAQKSREEDAKPPDSAAAGLGNLADYGDSSDEGEEENEETKDDAEAAESAARAARQARAKAWAESRRAAKSISSLEG